MSKNKDILETSVIELEKANLEREKAINLQIDSLNEVSKKLKGEDKMRFDSVKKEIERSLQIVRNGGDVNAVIESLKKLV